MRAFFYISIIAGLSACNSNPAVIDEKKADTVITTIKTDTSKIIANLQPKLSVIVLPPYDAIANAGISPGVQKYLETEIAKDTNLRFIKFSFKQFMNASYQNIYDKKYCQPIIEKVNPDIIVMSMLEQSGRTGQMAKDAWNLSIRIYNTHTGKQEDSKIKAVGLTDSEIKDFIFSKRQDLTLEIENCR